MARGGPRLTLIETALLASLVAIMLAVFVPTFLRRVRTNKIAEAPEMLGEMSRRASAYYATRWPDDTRACLPPGAGPTPEAPTVESVDVDFHATEALGHESWKALGFQPDRPVRFSYRYEPSRHGCGLESDADAGRVLFVAEGDLDGDGVRSTFERRSVMQAERLQPEGALHVHRRPE